MSRFSQHSTNSDALPLGEEVQVKAQVKWFDLTKGFGFVALANGDSDAFLHISVLNRAGLQDLAEGTDLVCQVAPGPKGPQVIRIIEVVGGGLTDESGRNDDYDRAVEPSFEMPGTVKWFKPDKGFGFVAVDDTGKDVFIHKSILRRCGLSQLESGQRVQMKVQEAAKGREATWITVG